MFPRSIRLAVALAMAAPAIAGAQHFAYAPGTTTYRIGVNGTGHVEQGGQSQDVSFESNQRLTVKLERRTADTLGYTATLDSLSGRSPNGMPITGDEARGLSVSALLAPTGKVYSVTLPADKPDLAQPAGEMARLLPALPADLHTGQTWVDTTHATVSQMGLDIQRVTVASYAVAGDTTFDGEQAWKITRTTATTISASGAAMGQPLTVEGSSSGTGLLFVSRSGSFLGGNTVEAVKTKVTLVAQGMEVNNTQQLTTQLSRVH